MLWSMCLSWQPQGRYTRDIGFGSQRGTYSILFQACQLRLFRGAVFRLPPLPLIGALARPG